LYQKVFSVSETSVVEETGEFASVAAHYRVERQLMTADAVELLATRRSVKPDLLAAPAPSAAELDRILTIAARVPDHKKLVPWRFMVFEGDARAKAGELFAKACEAEEAVVPSPVRLDMERNRFLRAPLVIGVVSRVVPRPGAPEWEQILSAGASAMNLCLAANAMGYGTSWITEWVAYSPTVRAGLGLAENERVAGFVHIGTARSAPEERERPKLGDIVTRWGS
jgi:nitroreductase